MAKAPAIVLVQGSFQKPLVYERFTSGLKALGYEVVHPELPSCSNTESADFPSKTLDDDSNAVQTELKRLIGEEGKTVIVAMHSYGGLVGSNAIPMDLSYEHRRERNLPGGILHLFYICAFILDVGQSVLGTFGQPPHEIVGNDGRFTLKDGMEKLYNDLPEAEAERWGSRLIPQSFAVKTTALTQAGYKYIPSTYLVCEKDNAVPVQFQEMFAKVANARVERCAVGHSPMLSQTEMLVGKVDEVVKRASGELKSDAQ